MDEMKAVHVAQSEHSSANEPLEPSVGPPPKEIQELWFLLAKRGWQSLAIVPADLGGSARAVAKSLADVGKLLQERVTVFAFSHALDYGSAARMIPAVSPSTAGGPRPVEPAVKVIFALQPVVREPLGAAMAAGADTVVICVELGRTRAAAARRTIELIGRERVAGCIIVR
jgi:hypothetical protein